MSEDKFKIKAILKNIENQIIEYMRTHYGESPEHVILNLDIYSILKKSRELCENGVFRHNYRNTEGSCDEIYRLKIAIIQQKENLIKVC